jgi:ABC-type nitrate/sulfonate/bicarbonate transport system substrate-binding protein
MAASAEAAQVQAVASRLREPGGAMSRLMTVVAVLAAMAVAGAANAAETLVLQLHGPAQFRFAGYYAALWQGYYREAGLSVEIKPGAAAGQDPIDPVREVIEGRAQFGTGTAELLVRTAQGLPLLLLAPIFQQSGAAVYYRDDASFASPGALANAKIGRLPASDILDIELATALRAEGVDSEKLTPVPLQPGQTVHALADRSLDAAPGSAWDVPWLAQEQGFTVKSFNPADYRAEFYGDTLFTGRRLARAEAATVRAFRAATLKGWEYALQRPDEVAARMLAELPRPPGVADVGGLARYQAALAPVLARYPEIPLGHSNPERWRRIQDSMLRVGALVRTADPADFVYDVDGDLRSRNDLRALTIIGVTLAIAAAITAGLWRFRRRRPATDTVAAAAADRRATKPRPLPAETAAAALPAGPPPRSEGPAPASPARPAAFAEEPADLNAVLAAAESALQQLVPDRVSFRLSLLPELWRCRAEAPAVRTLVLDLVSGAASELDANGELIVGTRNYAFDAAAVAAMPGARPGEFVRVTVRDNGPGLSDDALDRVFDPAATARLSAATAAQAMRKLGGFARVESALGIGTAVHLYFPRVAAPAETTKAADAPKSAKAAE